MYLIDFYLVDDLNENFDELSNQNKGNFNFTHLNFFYNNQQKININYLIILDSKSLSKIFNKLQINPKDGNNNDN